MKILVTGGAGYIGSHVTRQLTEAGHKVIVFDNLSTGFKEALIHGEQLVEADLSDVARLDEILKDGAVAAVLHFAASVRVEESVADPITYYQNNVANTIRLTEACLRHGVKNIIYSGSAAVYGTPVGGRVDEQSPTTPISPYGTTKLIGEWVVRDAAAARPEFKCVVLRYFNVAGADPKTRMGQRTPEATHLITVACQAASGRRDKLEIFGTDYPTDDGTCVRDYIHVEDLAAAHLAALDYLARGHDSDIFNVGYGRGASVRRVVETVKKVSGVDFAVESIGRRPGDPPILIADSAKIRQVCGWDPQHDSLERIVEDAWRWELKLRQTRPSDGAHTP